MADELTQNQGTVKFAPGGSTVLSVPIGLQSYDVAGDECTHHTQEIGTSQEAVLLGDLVTGGLVWVHNKDSTNYITIRPGTGVADLIKVLAGEWQGPFRFASAAPFAIANTAACEVEFIMLEV